MEGSKKSGWGSTTKVFVLVVAAIVIAAAAWVFLIRGDEGSDGEQAPSNLRSGSGPVAATPADLAELESRLDIPVYWAGDQGEGQLELTRTSDDRVFVRYLDAGTELGDPDPGFLTVGTYPLEDAFDLLEQAGEREGAIVEDGPEGSLVVFNEDAPTSVYIGYPGEDYQVEVYDPNPDRALDLATSGQIEPAG